jgi:hypothetical protein
MEDRGGTYVSQAHASNADDALRSWAAALDTNPVGGLGAQRKRELMENVDLDLTDGIGPVRLQGLVDAWCMNTAISGGSRGFASWRLHLSRTCNGF